MNIASRWLTAVLVVFIGLVVCVRYVALTTTHRECQVCHTWHYYKDVCDVNGKEMCKQCRAPYVHVADQWIDTRVSLGVDYAVIGTNLYMVTPKICTDGTIRVERKDLTGYGPERYYVYAMLEGRYRIHLHGDRQ